MNEKLKALFENDILNEDTKGAIKDALELIREEAETEARKSLEVEYASKLTAEKAKLASSIMSFVSEAIEEEIADLKEDLKRYSQIDVEYARKLEEAKKAYRKSISEGVEKLITDTLAEEISELKEDIEEAKRYQFGKRLFESFKAEFEAFGYTDDAKKMKDQIDDLKAKLEEARKEKEEAERARIMESLLSNLSGSKRDVMATLLESVKTENLETRYNEVLESVMNDNTTITEDKDEEEKTVINEDNESDKLDEKFLSDVVSLARLK